MFAPVTDAKVNTTVLAHVKLVRLNMKIIIVFRLTLLKLKFIVRSAGYTN